MRNLYLNNAELTLAQSSPKESKLQLQETIEGIMSHSRLYRFYKMMQRIANVYYGKFMVVMIIILSIMANTIFSLIYIILLSLLVFYNSFFLNIKKARKYLRPLLSKVVIPFMIFELSIQFLYQIPIMSLEDNLTFNSIAHILGLENYFTVKMIPTSDPNRNLNDF